MKIEEFEERVGFTMEEIFNKDTYSSAFSLARERGWGGNVPKWVNPQENTRESVIVLFRNNEILHISLFKTGSCYPQCVTLIAQDIVAFFGVDS